MWPKKSLFYCISGMDHRNQKTFHLHAAFNTLFCFARHSKNCTLTLNFISSITIFSESVFLLCFSNFHSFHPSERFVVQTNQFSGPLLEFLQGKVSALEDTESWGIWRGTHEGTNFFHFWWKKILCGVLLSWLFEALHSVELLSIKCSSVDGQILNINGETNIKVATGKKLCLSSQFCYGLQRWVWIKTLNSICFTLLLHKMGLEIFSVNIFHY